MIFCRPVTIRAMRMAFSFASAPPRVKKKRLRSPGVSSASMRPKRARTGLAMPGPAYTSSSACRLIPSMTRLSPWPMFTHMSCEFMSM
jgi:hypothetical protein